MLLPAKVEFRIKKSILAVIGFFNFFFFWVGEVWDQFRFLGNLWETLASRNRFPTNVTKEKE